MKCNKLRGGAKVVDFRWPSKVIKTMILRSKRHLKGIFSQNKSVPSCYVSCREIIHEFSKKNNDIFFRQLLQLYSRKTLKVLLFLCLFLCSATWARRFLVRRARFAEAGTSYPSTARLPRQQGRVVLWYGAPVSRLKNKSVPIVSRLKNKSVPIVSRLKNKSSRSSSNRRVW